MHGTSRRLAIAFAVATIACAVPSERTDVRESTPAIVYPSVPAAPANPVQGAFPKVKAEARWQSYASVATLSGAADLIVRGQVVTVGPGRSIAGAASLPFTNASVLISTVAKGGLTTGATVTVEQTGGFYISTTVSDLRRLPQATPPPGAGPGVGPYPRPSAGSEYVFLEVEGDPLFFVREEVVLFLRWKSDLGVYQILGPQGRFRVLGQYLESMLPNDPVVGKFHGLSADRLLDEVKAR